MLRLLLMAAACVLGGCAVGGAKSAPPPREPTDLSLGNFSVSLAVKDLDASRKFYEMLGFRAIAGDGRGYLILQNDTSTIGIFEGMFDRNILTFNPGWDRSATALAEFDDVREIQRVLKSRGVAIAVEADETSSGPASVILFDPDGNQILLDQHVSRPER